MSTTEYRTNRRDVRFNLYEVFEVEKLFAFERFKECDRETVDMIIDEAAKFAETQIWPAHVKGDKEQVRFEDGRVYAPPSFHPVYDAFCEAGWNALNVSEDHGGQGLPDTVALAVEEFFMGSSFAFFAYPYLSVGAARLVESFGTEEQKQKYMKKMYSGEWGGTMCLTEPGAGSGLAHLTTKAKRRPDGRYDLSGTKIFITSGDYDMVPNIVHPVLARVEGGPPGIKGVSMFLVPKVRVNDDGSLGEPNDVKCGGVEHKICIRGSATCVLNFGEEGGCVAELIGEEGKGLAYMFQLMNEARLGVGIQGQAIASAAYLNALAYAKERLQGTEIDKKSFDKVPIIRHPDVRRMLMMMKSWVEGMRALDIMTAFFIDLSHHAEDPEERDRYGDWVQILTPLCKAYDSDMGFRVCELAIQVFGGYGVVEEYPVELYLRDEKIASIYEGTNGIQAMDLVGRKLPMKGGAPFRSLMQMIGAFVAERKSDETLGPIAGEVEKAQRVLVETAMAIGGRAAKKQVKEAMLNALPYLYSLGDVLLGYLLLKQAFVAKQKLEGGAEGPDAAFYRGKIEAARFFAHNQLHFCEARCKAILANDTSAIDIPEEAF